MEVDGNLKSGSGTILRQSIALAGILGESLHIYNIRQRRSQPGLRPQHLEAVLTAAKICNAKIKGVTIGSRELWFDPSGIRSGEFCAQIGTAGSIPMLLLTVLPILFRAENSVSVRVIKGGTDVRYSPTINYLKYVLIQMLGRMGMKASLNVSKYGYYPKGMGEVLLEVQPCDKLNPICIDEFGAVEELRGVSVCTYLEDRRVAARQAKAASMYLEDRGYKANIEVVNDKSNPIQRGSSLVLWAKTNMGALVGGDAIGEPRKSSEAVGQEAAENLFKEVKTKATVDVHLADMLVPYVALADGKSVYFTRALTDHLDTSIWLAQKILGVNFRVTKVANLYRIEKIQS